MLKFISAHIQIVYWKYTFENMSNSWDYSFKLAVFFGQQSQQIRKMLFVYVKQLIDISFIKKWSEDALRQQS